MPGKGSRSVGPVNTRWLLGDCPSARGSGRFSKTICSRPMARTAASGVIWTILIARYWRVVNIAGGIVIIHARLRLVQEIAAYGIHTRTITKLLLGGSAEEEEGWEGWEGKVVEWPLIGGGGPLCITCPPFIGVM